MVKAMNSKQFDRLLQSANEAAEFAEGKRHDLRTTILPATPANMSKDEIVSLRKRLKCSQAVFARALNVSLRTIQAWEQGLREPSDAALKLLSIASRRPEVLFE